MRTATVDEITSSIATVAEREPGGAIVFDGDGTLWAGDIGDDYFAALVADGRLTKIAHEALVIEARAENVDTSGSASDVARRIHEGDAAGTVPEERVCELMAWACAGWSRSELDAFAAKIIPSFDLPARLHDEAVR